MSNYNPNAPIILGQEWLPIREEEYVINADSGDDFEVGHTFILQQSRVVDQARVYASRFPAAQSFIGGVNIYPKGAEALSGPIRKVVIPVNSLTATGSLASSMSPLFLFSPSDAASNTVQLDFNENHGFTAYFATNSYAQMLNGKRILGVNVLYSCQGQDMTQLEFYHANGGIINPRFAWVVNEGVTNGYFLGSISGDTDDPIVNSGYNFTAGDVNFANTGQAPVISRARLPVFHSRWNTPTTSVDYLPWTYADLQKFEGSAGTGRYGIQVWHPSANLAAGPPVIPQIVWNYMALEVIFCEETRVAAGGSPLNTFFSPTGGVGPASNAAQVNIHHIATRATDPVLASGDYTITTSAYDYAGNLGLTTAYEATPLQAARQLYMIPTLEGVKINVPFGGTDENVGKTFSRETTSILPMMSLHTTGGAVLTEGHTYGYQSVAQVFGTVTATQDINEDADAAISYTYDQVRFYARRFGDTTIPLLFDSPEVVGFTASITPVQFDALPEILDGWKEITLPIQPSGVPMGATAFASPSWRWSATGEQPGNRWEVLGAAAPAMSGNPSFGLLPVPAAFRLGNATYGIGSTTETGTQITESWVPGITPPVSATAGDGFSDATVLFSMNPPAVSGLTVSVGSQPLSGTAGFCPVATACIPTALTYNRVTWTRRTSTVVDFFSRVAVSGWGSTDTGQAWANTGTSGLYSVNGSAGLHFHPGAPASTLGLSLITLPSADGDVRVDWMLDQIDTTGANSVDIHARRQNVSNFYSLRASVNANQTIDLNLAKRVAGVDTILALQGAKTNLSQAAGVWFTMRLRLAGPTLQGKIWPRDLPEPNTWDLDVTDSSLTTAADWGVQSLDNTTGPAYSTYFDNFVMKPPNFGALELQRFDPVDGAFNTIMLATNPALSGFNDYEARVGQVSVYRIRERNEYDFAGLWSPQASGSVASPGVVGASVSLLLFTSNFFQSGSSNLAYSASWETTPTETFTWPEGQQVTLQDMFGKDFATAFHPLERGGERFTSTLLVNAAGVPAAITANGFKSLRDMAWNAAPYICVRDELGNRWFASVAVPQGTRKRMRAGHLDLADVSVAETSETPYPVDPT
jgi:hypothetical protein